MRSRLPITLTSTKTFAECCDQLAAFHEGRMDILRMLPPKMPIKCLICDGTADPQCGCDGFQTAEEALVHLKGEIEILYK